VLSSTVSEILQVFVLLTPPIFYPNFGGVPFGPDRPCWGQCEHVISSSAVKLFSKYSNLSKNTPQRHGRTDGWTDDVYCGITALCVASRGKKSVWTEFFGDDTGKRRIWTRRIYRQNDSSCLSFSLRCMLRSVIDMPPCSEHHGWGRPWLLYYVQRKTSYLPPTTPVAYLYGIHHFFPLHTTLFTRGV